jgi:hypothetical protein
MRRISLLEAIKWALAIVLIVFLVFRAAETGDSRTPFAQVLSAVTKTTDMSKMNEGDRQMLRRIYGLNPTDYQEIRFYYPATNMAAEELFLVKLSDKSQRKTVMDVLQKRIQSQISAFSGYGTTQTAMLKKAVIDERGNYVLMIVAEHPEKVKAAFEQAL